MDTNKEKKRQQQLQGKKYKPTAKQHKILPEYDNIPHRKGTRKAEKTKTDEII